MKRIALLAAAVLASGCVSSAPGDVVVYWNFSRNTLVSPFSVLYDSGIPSLVGDGPCTDSRVEKVTVTDLGGALIDPAVPTIPCVWSGVQGATFQRFDPGTYAFVVHGWRTVGGVLVEVNRGQGSVYVSSGVSNPVTITAAGLQDDLDVFLYQGTTLFSCATGDTLGWTLTDTRPGTPTIIESISGILCGNPILFRVPSTGVDLDGLRIRVQVTNSSVVRLDSGTTPVFGHFGNDTAANGWAVALF